MILIKKHMQPTVECSCQGVEWKRIKRKRRVRKPPENGKETKVWWFFLLKKLLKGG